MRPYGTNQQLQEHRKRALKLLEEGKSAKEVAARMKVTVRSVYRWRQEQKQPKPKSERPPGKPSYLTKKQIKKLEQALLPKRWRKITLREVQATLREAFCEWGLPEEIQTDQETVDVGSRDENYPSRFTLWLAGLDIRHLTSRSAHPTDQGAVEREHHTLFDLACKGQTFSGVASWQHTLDETRSFHNFIRCKLGVLLGKKMALPEIEIIEESETDLEPLFKVILHNDDVTPMDFVVHILKTVFYLANDRAAEIMLTAHIYGSAYVQTLAKSEAEKRLKRAHFEANNAGYPLKFTMEPE